MPICDGMEALSLTQSTPIRNTSCASKKSDMLKGSKDESESQMDAQKKEINYTFHFPSYLTTSTKEKKVPAVTPSPIRKRSRKQVSWNDTVEHIDDESTVKTSNKKARTYARKSPYHKTVPLPKDKGLK